MAFEEHPKKGTSLPCVTTTAFKLGDDSLLVFNQLLTFGDVPFGLGKLLEERGTIHDLRII